MSRAISNLGCTVRQQGSSALSRKLFRPRDLLGVRYESQTTSSTQIEHFNESTPHPGRYASDRPSTSVVQQLRRVRELQERVAAENSKSLKRQIIAEYPDLRDLLEHVYDPNHRAHLSFSTLESYLANRSAGSSSTEPDIEVPSTITGLLDILASRHVTGNSAKSLVVRFLETHGISIRHDANEYPVEGEEGDLEVFGRLLDRNLVAGFGARTLREVEWNTRSTSSRAATRSIADRQATSTPNSISAPTSSEAQIFKVPPPPRILTVSTFIDPSIVPESHSNTIPKPNRDLTQFSAALGKTILPPFTDLYKSGVKWYASRKLDGVRCITYLDFLVPNSNSDGQSIELVNVGFYSRTGKAFTSLRKVEDRLGDIASFPQLREWLDRDPITLESGSDGEIKRLVLDGEICVMRQASQVSTSSERPNPLMASSHAPLMPSKLREDDGTGSGEQWSTQGLTEDFASTVSEIRRGGSYQIAHPVYFLFDIIPYAEFNAHKSLTAHETALGANGKSGLGRAFSQRIDDMRVLGDFLASHRGDDERGKIVGPLAQWPLTTDESDEVEKMVERAVQEGWEGLIFRADKGYKGTRSSDIRKFKQWQDGEYTVHRISTSRMRLALNGVFDEHEALASVWIKHKGHEVSVGSGFTAEERVIYAKEPERIIGKEITVEYFSESTAVDRAEGTSLRFPRVKRVWEEGKRSI